MPAAALVAVPVAVAPATPAAGALLLVPALVAPGLGELTARLALELALGAGLSVAAGPTVLVDPDLLDVRRALGAAGATRPAALAGADRSGGVGRAGCAVVVGLAALVGRTLGGPNGTVAAVGPLGPGQREVELEHGGLGAAPGFDPLGAGGGDVARLGADGALAVRRRARAARPRRGLGGGSLGGMLGSGGLRRPPAPGATPRLTDRGDQVALTHAGGTRQADLGGDRLQLAQPQGRQRPAAARSGLDGV
jgi:hypothetical protein